MILGCGRSELSLPGYLAAIPDGSGGQGGPGGSAQAGTGGHAGAAGHSVQEEVVLVRGASHSCALLDPRTVKCWGQNSYGQLGRGDMKSRGEKAKDMGAGLPAVKIGEGLSVVSLAAGAQHTCALFSNGRIKCWGDNQFGQLGLGDQERRGDEPGEMGDFLPFVNLGANASAVSLVAGDGHTCALLSTGAVKCWGQNGYGQCGDSLETIVGDEPGEMGDALPSVDTGSVPIRTLSAGAHHTCAIVGDGGLKCWGDNAYGQLGLGDSEPRGDQPGEMGDALPFIELGAKARVSQVAASSQHTCALLEDGRVKCWGANDAGQIGLLGWAYRGNKPGQMGDALPAVDLGTGVRPVSLHVHHVHTCALLDDGRVKCWGGNFNGQLGLGDTLSRGSQPGEMGDALPFVELGSGVRSLALGSVSTCARLNTRRVKCWGSNFDGQLGLGDTEDRGDQPGEMGDALYIVNLGALVGP